MANGGTATTELAVRKVPRFEDVLRRETEHVTDVQGAARSYLGDVFFHGVPLIFAEQRRFDATFMREIGNIAFHAQGDLKGPFKEIVDWMISIVKEAKYVMSENPESIQSAAYNLGRVGVKEAAPDIRELLRYGDGDRRGELSRLVRRDAAVSLALLGDKESIPKLREMLFARFRRESDEVLRFVALSLAVLGDRDERTIGKILGIVREQADRYELVSNFVNGEMLFALLAMGKGNEIVCAPQAMTVERLMRDRERTDNASVWARAALEKLGANTMVGGTGPRRFDTGRARFMEAVRITETSMVMRGSTHERNRMTGNAMKSVLKA